MRAKFMIKHNQIWVLIFVVFLCLFSLFYSLTFGAASISTADVISHLSNVVFNTPAESHFTQQIVWELRFPRSLLAFIAGVGLAVSGLILQTVTRNPLADPYLFGVSSGASFGVVILVSIFGSFAGAGHELLSSSAAISVAAFFGSLVAMLLLIAIAGNTKTQQVESMLLTGVALSFLFSALTSLLLYLTDPQAVTAILFWTLGSFTRAQWDTLWFPAVVILFCTTCMIGCRRQLNAMLLGDESASTLGIDIKRFRIIMLVLSSLITATLVSLCGGIGFVGLMIPHIVRFFVSQGSTFGLVLTALVGGMFMIWVDVLSRVLLPNQELPVGIITAVCGSIFFLSLLYFRKTRPSY